MKETTLNRFEKEFGLPIGFIEHLLAEDDWSFVIKINVLVEAACNNILLYHFKEPDISGPLSFLELADPRKGKIVFLKKLGLISSGHSKMIAQLGKLRNDFAHKISDIHKTLEDKFNGFDKNQKKNFLEAFPLEGAVAQILMRDYHNVQALPKLETKDMISKLKNKEYNLKLQIWSSVFSFLTHIEEIEGFSDYRQHEKAEQVKDK